MVHLRSLCQPNAVRRYGLTNFQFLGEDLKRVDVNAIRMGRSSTVYFELPDLRLAACGCRHYCCGHVDLHSTLGLLGFVFDVGNIGGQIMSSTSIVHSRSLTRRSALGIVALALVMPSVSAFAQPAAMLVHKDPNCSCCSGWVKHLKDAGFAVTVEETTDLQPVRKRLGVPADLAACHTAKVEGYVRHAPAVAVRLLLAERPTASGLSVPGMPAGSPGMEGGTPQRYDVILFGKTGRQPFMHFVGSENVG